MGLQRGDKEFQHPAVSRVNYKQLEMDRVLTGLLPRLWWGGPTSVLHRDADLGTDDFVEIIEQHPELFTGFEKETTHRWVETSLLDLINRGKPSQAVAGLRPLHGFTYRLRNTRRSRSHGADEQLYAMIKHASKRKGERTLPLLKDFFFDGVDNTTGRFTRGAHIDVETQALINLFEAVRDRVHDRKTDTRAQHDYPPLYQRASDLLVEDVNRLLFHRHMIPRSVMVDYMKVLFAFHLALYHLEILRYLPQRVKGGRPLPEGGFFLDVAGAPGSAVAMHAERSAAAWYDRVPEFVRATFTVKKLDDFAKHLAKLDRRSPRQSSGAPSVDELLALLGTRYKEKRANFADARLSRIVETSQSPADDENLDPTVAKILDLGLDPFTMYVEIVTALRIGYHRKHIIQCLDSLLLKNLPGAMIAQPYRGARRFVLDSRLLEVLLHISLLQAGGSRGFHTKPLRVDEFLDILRERYGLYIDRLPSDGFDRPGITNAGALRNNVHALVARLREIGFYSDLSDAYLTQTITPRYAVAP